MLNLQQAHDGTAVTISIDLNARPLTATLTADGLTWTYHWFTTPIPGVHTLWKATHDGRGWSLVGRRPPHVDGLMWMLSDPGTPGGGYQLNTPTPVEQAVVWASRLLTQPTAFFTPDRSNRSGS